MKIRMTARQAAALGAMARADGPLTAVELSVAMSTAGRKWSQHSAYQAAGILAGKRLSRQVGPGDGTVRYVITEAGRQAAADLGLTGE